MIPIYRAKKIDSDEYVEGFYFENHGRHLLQEPNNDAWNIDPSTLAIHFPDMLDKNGKSIFASLSEDGKGGDIIHIAGMGDVLVTHEDQRINYDGFDLQDVMEDIESFLVKSIYEGEAK